MDKIIVKGARVNNLKNIDIELPKNKLIVMTGVSGSGKSSLAFDTIYAEGQRRYVESLSAYARQFLGGSEKPDVDSIEGLSPAISIDQKTTNKNPRSTVGTVTEIYDYLRLLYARIGVPYCPTHHIPISSQSIEEMVNQILKLEEKTKIRVLSPVVYGEKGTHKDLFEKLRKDGYVRVKVDGNDYDLEEDIILEKNKKHNIEVVVDRLIIKDDIRSRLYDSIEIASKLASGKVVIDVIGSEPIIMSESYACPHCDFSLPELEPRMFSFNAPYGACDDCKGLGIKLKIAEDLIVPNKDLSINEGAIVTLNISDENNINYTELFTTCEFYKIDMNKPFKDLKREDIETLFYGSKDDIEFNYVSKNGNTRTVTRSYEGIITNLERRYMETKSGWIRDWIENFMTELPCPTCHGARLNDSVLSVLIGGKNIYEITKFSIRDIHKFFTNLKLTKEQQEISRLIIKEINSRLSFLINVGLEYLTLDRSAGTLSGGEAQRIRLATQIGSRLTGVLYVLDEPSIGLHQRDNNRLINSMLEMRDLGNTLIVVEHDTDTMLASDFLVDIGPHAGSHGGEVVALGAPKEVMENENSLTGQYLTGKKKIEVPSKRRKGNKLFIEVKGATENNLKNINVKIPLGTFTCITGVSGSGKSTLVNEIIYKAVANQLYKNKERPGAHKSIKGLENIDKVVDISQAPIGRTPRSNPATYTGVFDDIRDVFTATKEAKMKGYDKGRFSFNVKGGRCEACWGDGVKKIEMHFLPDVYVPCEVCGGTRYNSETLEIKYKDKNIYDVLEMTVEEALDFFENIPKVKNKLQMLMDVGLSYVKLGQSAPTLSGGEAARVKLAKELQKRPTGKSLFILDEPTTGLHTDDIKKLLVILNRIVENGDTVLVIEHNIDVIKVADYIIDLGPEGGDKGGSIVAKGTPEDIVKVEASYTGKYLKPLLKYRLIMKKIKIKVIGFEVTRKCNIKCAHCIRGKSQNLDMTTETVDALFNNHNYQISEIDYISFTGGEPTLNPKIIVYIINKIIDKRIKVNSYVNFITNGLIYNQEIIDALYKLQNYFNVNNYEAIINYEISNDQFHEKIDPKLMTRYLDLPFINKSIIDNRVLNPNQIINEGYADENNIEAAKEISNSINEIQIMEDNDMFIIDNVIYISANGNVHTECMYSYKHFDEYAYGNINNDSLISILKRVK